MITDDVMDTDDVMALLGYTNPRGVSAWARRHGVTPLYKRAGHKGKNVYSRTAIEAAIAHMPGRGAGGGRPRRVCA